MYLIHLDETGIVRLGSHVRERDVLVGKLMLKQVKGTNFGWLDPFNGYSDTKCHGLNENKIMLVMMKKMNLMRIWWVILH